MKKIIAVLCVFAVCFSLSACELDFQSVDTLMKAPKLSGDERLLQDAFESYSSKYSDILMKTAVSGQYKSSYIIYDIDNDKENEALVLYSVPAENDFVNVAIFKQSNNEWTNVTEISGIGEEINSIDFADINGDTLKELFISWNGTSTSVEDDDNLNTSSNQKLIIYSYSDEKTEPVFSDSFNEFYKFDLRDDSVYGLALFKLDFADLQNHTEVRLIGFNKDFTIRNENITYLTPFLEIVNISSDQISYIDRTVSRIYVDGVVSESGVITEIIEIDEETLEFSTPLNMKDPSQNDTLRSSKIYCVDIDNDGYIEIPNIEKLPYGKIISGGNDDNLNLIVWSDYYDGKITTSFKCIYNGKLGYAFVFPEEQSGKMTVYLDENNNNLTFYSINSDGTVNNVLFSIRVFTVPEWEEDNYNYKMYKENDSYVYGYLIFKEENKEKYEKFITDNLLCFE